MESIMMLDDILATHVKISKKEKNSTSLKLGLTSVVFLVKYLGNLKEAIFRLEILKKEARNIPVEIYAVEYLIRGFVQWNQERGVLSIYAYS